MGWITGKGDLNKQADKATNTKEAKALKNGGVLKGKDATKATKKS